MKCFLVSWATSDGLGLDDLLLPEGILTDLAVEMKIPGDISADKLLEQKLQLFGFLKSLVLLETSFRDDLLQKWASNSPYTQKT